MSERSPPRRWCRALVWAAGIAALAGVGCRGAGDDSSSAKPAERAGVVADIGEHEVTEAMLELRRRHIDQYYPGAGSRKSALAQLVQGYLAAEVLRARGVILDRSTWRAERARIAEQTRDPERLAGVRAVYGDDEDAYLRVGVLPDFARARAHRFFRAGPSRAGPARRRASAFIDEAAGDPAGFGARARAAGGQVSRLIADPEGGMRPVADAEGDPGSARAKPARGGEGRALRERLAREARDRERQASYRLAELLASLDEGEVHPRTLETPEAFQAARLVRRFPDGTIEVELAAFPKPDFHAWFWDEASAVPIAIHDDALRDALVEEVSWAGELALASTERR